MHYPKPKRRNIPYKKMPLKSVLLHTIKKFRILRKKKKKAADEESKI